MRYKLVSALMLLTLLVSACASTASVTPTAVPTAASAVVEPTAAAAPTQAPEPKSLTVLAAASLTESFTELGATFETQHPGVKVNFSFAGSQQLAQQLDQGADADVFASASKKYMDAAVESKRVNAVESITFVKNRLTVIFPKDNPAGLKSLQDLAKPGIKLDLADKSVPVGQYSLDFLDKASKDAEYGAQFKDNVINNVVSYEDNVKAVVTKISLGEADAGIVYCTDISVDVASTIEQIEIPDALNTIATYPIAPISDSKNPGLAKAFVDLVMSADGQAVMAKYGFIPAGSVTSSTDGFTVTDAMGRQVSFKTVPNKIVLAGKALFMIADAIYTFPEAGKNIVALGSTAQGSGDFIPMIDPAFASRITLDGNAGVEQIAAANPDCVIMKSSNAEKLGKPLEDLKIPVVYLDFENPDHISGI